LISVKSGVAGAAQASLLGATTNRSVATQPKTLELTLMEILLVQMILTLGRPSVNRFFSKPIRTAEKVESPRFAEDNDTYTSPPGL
jgi:hypothetical protein